MNNNKNFLKFLKMLMMNYNKHSINNKLLNQKRINSKQKFYSKNINQIPKKLYKKNWKITSKYKKNNTQFYKMTTKSIICKFSKLFKDTIKIPPRIIINFITSLEVLIQQSNHLILLITINQFSRFKHRISINNNLYFN